MEQVLEVVGEEGRDYPRHAALLPPQTMEYGRWRARFARRPHELDEILRLRYEVFNLELGEGLDSSHVTRRDEDRFDASCHHLLVEEIATNKIVGTYRMQTCEMALGGEGFYSAGEFDLSQLGEEVLRDSIEVGRACIHRDHRDKYVLFLLWKGLAAYVFATGKRYFFGCSSLTSQDQAEGLRLHRQLRAAGQVHPTIEVQPLPALRCAAAELDAEAAPVQVPRLFRTYLRYGALVVSPPALDREFKTIDYLMLLDTAGISERTRSVFFGDLGPFSEPGAERDPQPS